jgi:hypothetical protein
MFGQIRKAKVQFDIAGMRQNLRVQRIEGRGTASGSVDA